METILAILRELFNFFLLVTWSPPFMGLGFLLLVGVLIGFVAKIKYFWQMFILAVGFIASATWPGIFLYVFPFMVLLCGFAIGNYMKSKWTC